MRDNFIKEWNLISRETAKLYTICCINEAVYTFAKDNNIEIPDEGGFALPYLEPFDSIVKDYIPRQWAIEYIHWAIDEAVDAFAKYYNLSYNRGETSFFEQFIVGLDNFARVWQEKYQK